MKILAGFLLAPVAILIIGDPVIATGVALLIISYDMATS